MSIADNIRRVEDRIAEACARANRDPATVVLVGIGKQKPASDIVCAIEAGLQHIGENRVEEGIGKIPQVMGATKSSVTWHMVGHVQSRKAKQTLEQFDVVHSIDSLRLAQRFSRLAVAMEKELEVLLEINVSGEASKYGFEGYNWNRDAAVKDGLLEAHKEITELPNLNVCGLMTMAPLAGDESTNRRVFVDLCALREELQLSANTSLPELSMGMTDDFELAIEEGSTMVRVGRAIFGDRS